MYRMLSTSLSIVLFIMLCSLGRYGVQGAGFRAKPFGFLRNFLSSSTTSYSRSQALKVEVTASTSAVFDGDLLVVPFLKPKAKNGELIADLKASIPAGLSPDVVSTIADILDENNFKADAASKRVVRLDNKKGAKYLALVGLGPSQDYSSLTLGRSVAEISKDLRISQVGIVTKPDSALNKAVDELILGLHDAAYNDERFRKEPEGGHPPLTLTSVKLLGVHDDVVKALPTIQKQSTAVAAGVHFARDLVGAPSNYKTPLEIANQARKIAADHHLEIKVLGEAECKSLGMGGYLGVQQGSAFPPQFIHMTYRSSSSGGSSEQQEKPSEVVKIALIGKGLTFDSGGYNLKVGATSMIEMMKIDMGGCAAVLGCAKVLGQLKPKNLEVHFISAVCENMISASAMRPGDVLVASNGKTIEVGNTDAEGRLTLADALVYAEKLKVDAIIDLATLTGACMVALGERVAGLYGSHPELVKDLQASSERTNDKLWHMPLEQSYRENIKSSIADIKNTGAKGGGSITAALFLQEFVDSTPWAHIDMAGPVWDTKKPSGFGVKLLVDYVLNAKKDAYKEGK